MMQHAIDLRSPVRQDGDDRTQGHAVEAPSQFTPLTEDDLIVSYSLSYRHAPDNVIETTFKNKKVIISYYNEISRNKIYTHSIEQHTKTNNNEFESWYKISVFAITWYRCKNCKK